MAITRNLTFLRAPAQYLTLTRCSINEERNTRRGYWQRILTEDYFAVSARFLLHTKQAGRITKKERYWSRSDGLWGKGNKPWTMHCYVWNLKGRMLCEHVSYVICDVLKGGTCVRQIFNIIHVTSTSPWYFEMLPNTLQHVRLTVKNQNSFNF